jgi:cobalt transporter subunit CbtB
MLLMSRWTYRVGSQSDSDYWKNKVLPALVAVALGVAILYAAGFAQIPELHNAAHDTRHAAGFPCH